MASVKSGYGVWSRLSKALAMIVIFFASSVAAQERPVIVAFGDSLTQGFGLAHEDGFVPQLQVWLERNGVDAELVNAGVSGDTTAGGAARIDWTLTDNVDAIIVALGGNDLLRGLDPAQARANLDAIVSAATQKNVRVLLVGMSAPSNFGASYKADFDAIYPELAQTYNTGFAPSFFAGFAEEGAALDPASVQHWMQSDGIHPNAEGVSLIVEALGPYVAELVVTP